jgi:hypothetical protein
MIVCCFGIDNRFMKAHIMFLGVILNENKLKSRGLGSQNSNLDFLVCLVIEKWHDNQERNQGEASRGPGPCKEKL